MNTAAEQPKVVKPFEETLKKAGGLIAKALYPPMKPAAIVIGTQKGGTTALYNYFSHHPGILCAKIKEISFFGCDRRYAKGLDFYHKHFPRRSPGNKDKITLDITPHYLGSASRAAPRIHRYDPGIKLIAVLRNPVDRAYSAWQMYRKYQANDRDWFYQWVGMCDGDEHRPDYRRRPPHFGENFEQDVRDEIEAIASGQTLEMPMLPQGCYADRLEVYLGYFPKEQLFVATSDELRVKTRVTLRRIEAFLALTPYDWPEDEIKPQFEGGYAEKPRARERDLLNAYYTPHNRKLYAMLGTDFGWE